MILATLTVFFSHLALLMLGGDTFLRGVLGTSVTPDWVSAPGGFAGLGAFVSAWAWISAAREGRRSDCVREEEARLDEERRFQELRLRRMQQDEEIKRRKSEEEQRRVLESLLRRDAVQDEINYISGAEFERFMADFLRRQKYRIEETKASGGQGVDLVLPDVNGKRVVVQLKRYACPVGNAAVQATFAGMAHYQANEGWLVTTSSLTKPARELARSTRVRLIDGDELGVWLKDARSDESY